VSSPPIIRHTSHVRLAEDTADEGQRELQQEMLEAMLDDFEQQVVFHPHETSAFADNR
jgi:hypothetical protein